MNTILWVLQTLAFVAFLYSGINKSISSEKRLVSIGQTGVEGLPIALIRFIGAVEILGSVGIIFPILLGILPVLTPIAAIGFAAIMIPAAVIHYKRNEPKNVLTNVVLFIICFFIAYGRIFPID